MPDPRAVPEAEVRERLEAKYRRRAHCRCEVCRFIAGEQLGERRLQLIRERWCPTVGLRWDGTAYLDTEGS